MGIVSTNKTIGVLLFVFAFLSFCSGQSNSSSQIDNQPQLSSSHRGEIMLTKKLGSDKYSSITCGLQDRVGNIWFGTSDEGVYKYDGKLFTQFTMEDGLSSNSISSLLDDKSGTIWFGTSNGICRTDGNKIIKEQIPFYIRPVINNNFYYTKYSTKSTVWSMMQDKTGKIWFGTGDGVYTYDGELFTRFLANDKVINKDSLKLKLVSDILEDKNGIIWFASGMPPGNEGFCRYDGKTIERFKHKNEGWIRYVIESKNGNLLLATRRFGIWSYDGKSFSDYAQPKELINGSLSAIMEDKSGELWIASDYGIDLGDTLGGLWHSTTSATNSSEKTFTKVFNKEVFFMLEDRESNIWFGTRGWGLYRYDRKVITKFSE